MAHIKKKKKEKKKEIHISADFHGPCSHASTPGLFGTQLE